MLDFFKKKSNNFDNNDIFTECKLLSNKRKDYVTNILLDIKNNIKYIDTNPDMMHKKEIYEYKKIIELDKTNQKILLSFKDLLYIANKYQLDIINETHILNQDIINIQKDKFYDNIISNHEIELYSHKIICYKKYAMSTHIIEFERWLDNVVLQNEIVDTWELFSYIFPLDENYHFRKAIGKYNLDSKWIPIRGMQYMVPKYLAKLETFGTSKNYNNKKYIDFDYPIMVKYYEYGIAQIIY